VQSINKVTLRCRCKLQNNFVPGNAYLVVVGDVNERRKKN
jgi:predicted Zn-dependent peptidase